MPFFNLCLYAVSKFTIFALVPFPLIGLIIASTQITFSPKNLSHLSTNSKVSSFSCPVFANTNILHTPPFFKIKHQPPAPRSKALRTNITQRIKQVPHKPPHSQSPCLYA